MDARVLVRYAVRADAVAVNAELATLARAHPGPEGRGPGRHPGGRRRAGQARQLVNYLMIGMLLAFIAVAAANSLVMATGERSRELPARTTLRRDPIEVISAQASPHHALITPGPVQATGKAPHSERVLGMLRLGPPGPTRVLATLNALPEAAATATGIRCHRCSEP